MKPPRGYEALRRRRVSLEGNGYFITLCSRHRVHGLNSSGLGSSIRRELDALEHDQALVLQSAVIMPDHLHLLVILTGRLTLGQVVGRLKAKTKPALQTSGLAWQGNYFEHRLRPDDPIDSVVRYLYLNPYRAKLIGLDETYPWFWLGEREAQWFKPGPGLDKPLPGWLVQLEGRAQAR